jgi:cytochrome c553
MMKSAIALIGAALAMAAAAPASAAGDIERGKTKSAACAACHAVGGDWNKPLQPEYPKLAGQHADYLATALTSYKQGDKSLIGRKNAIMAGQAAALSAQEIQDLAAYFSSLPGPLHVKR